MYLAFGDSIAGLALLGIIAISISIIIRYIYLRSRSAHRSVRLRITTGAAGLLLLTMVIYAINRGQIEYNPMIRSYTELIGDYEGNGYSLRLNADGTFTATGFSGGDSGEWSNFDFNLTLSGLGLSQPRVITRNGRLCIAPFYRGVDSHHGILLKKQ
jgi:hypothetical protein